MWCVLSSLCYYPYLPSLRTVNVCVPGPLLLQDVRSLSDLFAGLYHIFILFLLNLTNRFLQVNFYYRPPLADSQSCERPRSGTAVIQDYLFTLVSLCLREL